MGLGNATVKVECEIGTIIPVGMKKNEIPETWNSLKDH